jgi:hypothetical protein
MATRSEQRLFYAVFGAVGFAIIAIELFTGRLSPLTWIYAGLGLAAMIVAILKYRSLLPRRRKLYDE